MTAFGLIFSNIHDNNLPELTRRRTMASIPFGCRYRLIDFPLSNMVNSDIFTVGVITHYKYQSLMDHLGSGKDWDLARRQGGLKILPPYITAFDRNSADLKPYSTRLEALIGVYEFISHCTEDYVVLCDCDILCNIDLKSVLEEHMKNSAEMTIVTKSVELSEKESMRNTVIRSDNKGRITEIMENPAGLTGTHDICLNIWVLSRRYLQNIILDAISHGYTNFNIDIIAKNLCRNNFRVYRYDGYYTSITSISSYLSCNLALLESANRNSLFNIKHRPIYTKVRNSPPTKYFVGSNVKNSLIADGCIIKGTVENSILFRGVKIGENTVVKNSVIMQDTITGDNVTLNCVISDKNVVIKNGRNLSGHESMPFYIDKGQII